MFFDDDDGDFSPTAGGGYVRDAESLRYDLCVLLNIAKAVHE